MPAKEVSLEEFFRRLRADDNKIKYAMEIDKIAHTHNTKYFMDCTEGYPLHCILKQLLYKGSYSKEDIDYLHIFMPYVDRTMLVGCISNHTNDIPHLIYGIENGLGKL